MGTGLGLFASRGCGSRLGVGGLAARISLKV